MTSPITSLRIPKIQAKTALLLVACLSVTIGVVTQAAEQVRVSRAKLAASAMPGMSMPMPTNAAPPQTAAQKAQTRLDRDFYNAINAHNRHRAQQLLAQGANINATQRPWFLTPLLIAPDLGLDTVKFLVAHGANVNVADRDGTTVLMKAVRANAPAIVDFLLANGADVKARDGRGDTALILAVIETDVPAVAALIKHGADVNVIGDRGDTPLSIAKRERKAAEEMKPEMDMKHDAAHPMIMTHKMRTRDESLQQTKAMLQLLAKTGATLDQQPVQQADPMYYMHHHHRG